MEQGYKQEELEKLHHVQIGILKDFITICDKYNLSYFMMFGSAIGAVRHKGFIPWDDDIDVGMMREDYDKFLRVIKKGENKKYEIMTPYTNKAFASSVTHFQKKGTKFITQDNKLLRCVPGISIDIFALDSLHDDTALSKKQMKKTWFSGRLLFLTASPKPNIPIKGLKGKVAGLACFFIHYGIRILGLTPRRVYGWLQSTSRMYNHIETKYVVPFESAVPYKEKVKREYIFPLQEGEFEGVKVKLMYKNHEMLTDTFGDYMQLPPIEQRVNHRPLMIDFGK